MDQIQDVDAYILRKEWPAPNSWLPYISACIPVDVPNIGAMTKVILENGYEFFIGMSAAAVCRAVVQRYYGGIEALRKYWKKFNRHTQSVPVPIAARALNLMPIKLRRHPQGKNDGTMGCIADRSIKMVKELPGVPNQTHILLATGHKLVAQISYPGFVNAFNQAKLFTVYLQQEGVLPYYDPTHNTGASPFVLGGPTDNPFPPQSFWPTYPPTTLEAGPSQPYGAKSSRVNPTPSSSSMPPSNPRYLTFLTDPNVLPPLSGAPPKGPPYKY
ncbi:hypothetical protein D2Q93_16655 [Alicyclobacillaceae bacterium I2511]|nr:hypothetical protein D2Q93_16655 [Alicyclobacillaceae bacterium I2511]